MFNQEQKERYINAKEETTIVANNYLKRLFNYMEKYEEEKQKDLSLISITHKTNSTSPLTKRKNTTLVIKRVSCTITTL